MIGKAFYLTRDFIKILRGTDYFHQPQPLGRHFDDPRCYYNDMRGKANWTGAVDEGGLPLVFLPTQRRHIHFPITILLYGIGSFDSYCDTGKVGYIGQVARATRWVLRNVNSDGYLDNLFPMLEPEHSYYSANSALAQGAALSLLTRVHREGASKPEFLAGFTRAEVAGVAQSVYSNMVKPLGQNGTAIQRERGPFFCEVCRRDEQVVLNGWIYALFGLLDYWRWSEDEAVRRVFDSSVAQLVLSLPSFAMPGGWSLYDNKGRICSPFYHKVHIALLEAMARLTGERLFWETRERFARGYWMGNRVRFTIRKIADKVRDRVVYATTD